ncbi:molybdopterin-containing oxidoreductase family protein [Limnoglobus roseus]|uniref:Molybdopterin oxidoreductase family protein n=1 Tax=Limnoglobus roseus TaxID=2598579 RepID=A0A5C1AJZ0_9BACT|nr:molybdopterin oxidoreductase family protein [Limnoglobus roseus]QEL19521.1 molybdopterin oxidoreductase family protein [Limnoglobus roseus]
MQQELLQVRAVCPLDCPDACGLVVTVDPVQQKAVKLRGDADHPFTQGFLCRKVNHYLERVYHPERLLHPLKRVGPKGSGRFERIAWDEAIDTIAGRLKQVIGEFGPQAVLPYSYAGTMGKIQGSSLDRRFFHRLGASLLDRTICSTAGSVGCGITLGVGIRAAVEPEQAVNCRYIVNWASNTVATNPHFWAIQHEARKRGAKIVTIDPYRSPTAEKSDWWLPIRPGTDAALALGVMHIIFREGWQDQDYLDQYCLGADALRQRAQNEYTPETVSRITGLSVAEIEQFAKEYACSRQLFGGPALIRLNYGLQRHGGGGMAVRTVVCLPAVTGDWRYPGAGAFLSTSRQYPFDVFALERPDLIPAKTRVVNMVQLAEALHGELPGPPVKALVVYNTNPATVCPDQSRVVSGFRRDDLFTVVLEHFLTDTAREADIVLPATCQLEHWDIMGSYGHLYVQANPPAIPPPGEAKPNTEIFRLLAAAMGFERELFEASDEDLCRQALTDSGGFAGITFDQLREGQPVRLNLPTDWAPFAQGNFGTPSGKCYLFNPNEEAAGRDPLPHYIPPHEEPQTQPQLAAKYPLQMITPRNAAFLNSTFVEVDHLRRQAAEPTVNLHPDDAAVRLIENGDAVTIFNDRGRFRARASVGDSVKPGVVVTHGVWWSRYTPDGQNSNALTSTAVTDFGGGGTFFDSLVEVTRAN